MVDGGRISQYGITNPVMYAIREWSIMTATFKVLNNFNDAHRCENMNFCISNSKRKIERILTAIGSKCNEMTATRLEHRRRR